MRPSKEIKTGILVIVSIAVFVYGFNFLKGKNLFSERRVFYAVYPEVAGIVEANPVQLNGFKVGRVKDIQLFGTSGKIIVTFTISDKNLNIPQNSVAKIISSDLLGAKAIQLIPSTAKEFSKDGDTLIGIVEASLQESVNATVKPLKDKAEKLISSIDSIMLVVQAVLDKSTRENLSKSFESIKHALETFDRTSMRLDTLIASERYKISTIFSKVESISSNLASNNDKISSAIKNFSSISDTLAKANLSKTIENANSALTSISSVMEKINKGEGSAGLLVRDDKLYKNLSSASGNLDSLLKDMDENPWRYFSLYGKKKRTKKHNR
ncbi:MAG: MCE family protein [Bacteroidetes bacterium]|nr:MCE family protein [Bacteroidota bacterium]